MNKRTLANQVPRRRDCSSLARILISTLGRSPETLATLRRQFPREHIAARLVSNFWKRDAAIFRDLQANLANQSMGHDVTDSITDWRNLNIAIEEVLDDYWNDLRADLRQQLASLLISILDRIFQYDQDLYAGRQRTVFAGESAGGNLFRRFLSSRAKPIEFLGPLNRLDASVLATQRASLTNLINRYRANGGNGAEPEQYDNVAQALMGIWNRMSEHPIGR